MYDVNQTNLNKAGLETAVKCIQDLFEYINTKDGFPYSDHCITVANFAYNLAKENGTILQTELKELLLLALFHDVVEDLSQQKIQEAEQFLSSLLGSDNTILFKIRTYLTYDKNTQTRSEYINKIVSCLDAKVRLVKQADLVHNSLISRTKPNHTIQRSLLSIEKYLKELQAIRTGVLL